MPVFASLALQEAVFTRLSNAPSLMDRRVAVYDEPPEGAVFPYVAFGESRYQPYHTKDTFGATLTFDIHVWSDSRGQIEAKEMTALIDAELTNSAALPVAGYVLVNLRLENSKIVQQSRFGRSLYRGWLSYRAVVFKAAA